MFDFWKDYMSDTHLTLVKCRNDTESYLTWIGTWGRMHHPYHSGVPEVQIQWNPHWTNSVGRKPAEPLVDPRNLIKKEVQHAGSTNPIEPLLNNFSGKKASGASRGPETPHRGGSSYAQLSVKIEKLNSSVRKWNALSVKRSASVTTASATATTPAHPKMICWGVLEMT